MTRSLRRHRALAPLCTRTFKDIRQDGYRRAVSSDLKAALENWRGWITGPIRSDVIGMHHRRFIWRRVGEIAGANPDVGDRPSAFWDFLAHLRTPQDSEDSVAVSSDARSARLLTRAVSET